jgi:flavin reductase (DIM6/NTAB) family NADH-FMN oxidoreductase RutF
MECRVVHAVELRDIDARPAGQFLVVGQVVGVHLDESVIRDGIVETTALSPVARLGGPGDYAVIRNSFHMTRPTA